VKRQELNLLLLLKY